MRAQERYGDVGELSAEQIERLLDHYIELSESLFKINAAFARELGAIPGTTAEHNAALERWLQTVVQHLDGWRLGELHICGVDRFC